MGKLFGTDGIRGVANETLTCQLAYRVGQAAAISLGSFDGKRPKVVIGKDTRISSDMLEAALLAGLTASGCDAVKLGVIPTPAVAYLTVREHADAGIVISASHNPFEHNGIKMFSSRGFKLSDELEANIESLILQEGKRILTIWPRRLTASSPSESSLTAPTARPAQRHGSCSPVSRWRQRI